MDKVIFKMSRLRTSKFGHYLYYPKYIGQSGKLIELFKLVEDKEYNKGGVTIYRTGLKYANEFYK